MKSLPQYEPDFQEANAELDELIGLANDRTFDLFEFLRLFSEAGAPVFTCKVDDEAAGTTNSRIVRYQLSEGLRVILAALRTQDRNGDMIQHRSDRSDAGTDATLSAR